jgi:hypothetical protein
MKTTKEKTNNKEMQRKRIIPQQVIDGLLVELIFSCIEYRDSHHKADWFSVYF